MKNYISFCRLNCKRMISSNTTNADQSIIIYCTDIYHIIIVYKNITIKKLNTIFNSRHILKNIYNHTAVKYVN